jgi:hypothetical protein
MRDVIEMARESRLDVYGLGKDHLAFVDALQRFAVLVRADERERAMRENAYVQAEREACAKVCEEYDDEYDVHTKQTIKGIALQIRNRGQA